MAQKNVPIVMMACGDVGPVHEPVDGYGELARATLAQADLRIAQCEVIYSTRGEYQVHSGGLHTRLDPSMAGVFVDCGFDVVSVASNHAMDWGPQGLLDTIDVFESRGIRAVGGGRNIDEACEPAIIKVGSVTVAVLAFCSVLRDGYAAGPGTPGIAPLRAHTYYRPKEYQPGMPPDVVTVPYQDDLSRMLEAVDRARQLADVVVLSVHWGLHFIPRTIADYQEVIADAAFRGGVDLIVGHHPHLPKAVVTFDRGICFYSLGNFIMTIPEMTPEQMTRLESRYGVELEPGFPRFPFGKDGRRSLIAKAELSSSGVNRVSFLPVMIDEQLRPEILKAGDPRFDEVVQYLGWASAGFEHDFTVDGDEVTVMDANGQSLERSSP